MQTDNPQTQFSQNTSQGRIGANESMNLGCRARLVISTVVSIVAADQIAKYMARRLLHASPPHSYLGDVFRLEYSENKGAFLSLGSMLPDGVRFWLFTVLVGLVIGYLLFYTLQTRGLNRSQLMALTFLSAGGLGNWIDRVVFHGYVTDFLNVGSGSLRTGIFNIADAFQMAGVAMLLLNELMDRRRKTI